jgi:hypothetical protein
MSRWRRILAPRGATIGPCRFRTIRAVERAACCRGATAPVAGNQRARGDSNLRPAVSALSGAFAPGRTISSPSPAHGAEGGRRALRPSGVEPSLRVSQGPCGGIAGAAHPLVSTPSVGDMVVHGPADGSARDYPSHGWGWASPSSPGSPRSVPAACSRPPDRAPLC